MKIPLFVLSVTALTVIAYHVWTEEKKDLGKTVQCGMRLDIRWSITRKEMIAQKLIDGRITLRSASKQFLAINHSIRPSSCNPEWRNRVWSTMQVLAYVRVLAPCEPTLSPELITRLEIELKNIRGYENFSLREFLETPAIPSSICASAIYRNFAGRTGP
jgi:hypothetical protein